MPMTHEKAAQRIAEQIILDAERTPALFRPQALRIAALLQMLVDDVYRAPEAAEHG